MLASDHPHEFVSAAEAPQTASMPTPAAAQATTATTAAGAQAKAPSAAPVLLAAAAQPKAPPEVPKVPDSAAGDADAPQTQAAAEAAPAPAPVSVSQSQGGETIAVQAKSQADQNAKLEECCKEDTALCQACQHGYSLDVWCDEHRSAEGCSETLSVPSVTDEPTKAEPKIEGVCCKDLTAECMSCQDSVTVQQWCTEHPQTEGCDAVQPSSQAQPQALPTPAPAPAPPVGAASEDTSQGPMCCQSMTAPCLSCKRQVTLEEYCRQHSSTDGCPKEAKATTPVPVAAEDEAEGPPMCCEAMTVACLSCQRQVTPQTYCDQFPSTDGCPQEAPGEEVKEVKEESAEPVPPAKLCCKEQTATCQSCVAGISVEDYCGQHASTKGCPKLQKQETNPECRDYMKTIGCGWTLGWNCPGQKRGNMDAALDDGSHGYECCCVAGLWTQTGA